MWEKLALILISAVASAAGEFVMHEIGKQGGKDKDNK